MAIAPGRGIHLLSGGDPFNRHFHTDGCDIRIGGIHPDGLEDSYHIADPTDMRIGVSELWRDLVRDKGSRYDFEVVASRTFA